MNVYNNENYKMIFLKELLIQTYNLNKIYDKKQFSSENVKIPFSENRLKEDLLWIPLLGNALNLSQLKAWFENFKKPDDIYPLSYYIPAYASEFINVKIYEEDLLHLSAHFKIHKNLTQTFNLLIIFSFWVERPQDLKTIDLDYINSLNRDLIMSYTLGKKFLLLDYTQLKLFDIDNYHPEKSNLTNIKNQWIKNKPLFFSSYGIELLNANHINLIDYLISTLGDIENVIKSNKESDLKTSNQFFLNLSSDLKDFLMKGNELFQIAKDSLDVISKPEKKLPEEVEITKIEEKEGRNLTPKILLSIFEQTYDKDRDKGISIKDCGFRSLSELYKEFEDQYPFSKQTYYNCLQNSKLDIVLEQRQRNKKGGGTEYRIKKVRPISEFDEKDIEETFMREKMLVENALIHYNNKELTQAINLFEEVLKSPTEQLQNNNELYFGSKYYLGKSYYKIKKYQKALEIFKDINKDNDNLIEVNYYMIKIYLLLHNYNDLRMLLRISIEKTDKIFKKFKIEYKRESLSYEKNLKQGDDLTAFIFFLNTTKLENIFNRSILKNQTVNFYTLNFVAVMRLVNLNNYLLKEDLELRRRVIFRLVLENNIQIVQEKLDHFILLLGQKNYQNCLEKYELLLYPHYFKQLLKSHIKDYDFTTFDSKIESIFPGFTKHYIPFIDNIKKLSPKQKTLHFINEINNVRHDLEYDAEKQPLIPWIHIKDKLEFIDSEFILEYIYYEAFYAANNDMITKYIEQVKIQLKNFPSNKGIYELYQLWNITFLLDGEYQLPNRLIDRVQYAISLCKKDNLEELIVYFENLNNEFKKKVKTLDPLRDQLKKKSIEEIFKQISQKYTPQVRRIINLSFEDKLQINDEVYFDEIYPKIVDLFQDKDRVLEVNIRLSSEEATSNAYQFRESIKHIFEYGLFNRILISKTPKNTISIQNERVCQYKMNNSFEENLSDILYDLIKILEANYYKLIIATKSFKDEKFSEDFKLRVQKELKNKYFNIEIEKTSNNDELAVLMIKKEK